MAKTSQLYLRDDSTGYTRELGIGITLSNINGCTMDPVLYNEASMTLIGSQKTEKLKDMTNVCLLRYQHTTYINGYELVYVRSIIVC